MRKEDYENFLEYLSEEYPDSILLNPDYAGAIVGLSTDGRVVYNYRKMVQTLVQEDMTEEEAIEFIDYNTIRSLPYAGEKAPIVMYDIEDFEEF